MAVRCMYEYLRFEQQSLTNKIEIMKKIILAMIMATALQASAFASPVTEVNEKVMKAFTETFRSAAGTRWSVSGEVYEACFTYNDLVTRVRYDAEGNTLKTIRYYTEQQLPLSILARVKKQYGGQKVHSVTEVTVEGGTEYHITLEDAWNWTLVLGDTSGCLQLERKLIKA
jgi:hypothetical protein